MYVHDNTYIPPKILASLHFISLHFTSLPIFQFRPLSKVLSSRFKSVHFTPNFSLPATFRRFVITLQIRSLHFTSLPFFISGHVQTFYRHASNPFTSLHFTPHFSLPATFRLLSSRFKSVQFTSLHFTPHFSLPATFRRFIITLQIRSLHFTSLPFFISGHFQTFYHHASNPFTSLHFTSLPIFHFQPLSDVLSSRFKSVHFTPHFSLPATFKCFIITPQIRSLHFNFHHFTSLHFTSLHFTSLVITFLTPFLKTCDLQGKVVIKVTP